MKCAKRLLSLLSAMALIWSMALSAPALAAGMEHFSPSDTYTDSFPDVSHESWFYEPVKLCYEYELMKGTSGGTFQPRDSLTVAQALVMADRVHQIYAAGRSTLENGRPWYRPYVDYALAEGIIDGEWDSYSRPITRSEMASIFYRALPPDELKAINQITAIPDVSVDQPHGSDIYRLYRAGVLTGSGGGFFRPDDLIIRAEAAAILARIVLPDQRKSFSLDGTDPSPDQTKTLARQLEGLYTIPVEGSDENEQLMVEVRVIGDRICAELGYVIGECYSFWAYDLEPAEPELLQSTQATVLPCTAVEYSLMQGAPFQPPRPMEIGLKDGGLLLDGTVYQPAVGPSPFHSDPGELRQMTGISNRIPDNAPPTGRWFGNLNGQTSYLVLEQDGSMLICHKVPGKPMTVAQGVWQWDSTVQEIRYVAEKIGSGKMPLDETVRVDFTPDGAMMFNNFPLYPAPEQWSMDGLLGGLLHEQITAEPVSGEVMYSFHLPYVNGPSYGSVGISQVILDTFGELIRDQQSQLAQDGLCQFPTVNWSASLCGDILSLRVWADSVQEYREYGTYFYHTKYHDILNSREVLSLLGISGKDFVDRTKTAVTDYFHSRWGGLTPEEREAMGYDYFLNQTLDAIHSEMMYFLTPDGTPAAVVPVGTMAGAGICSTPILLPDF